MVLQQQGQQKQLLNKSASSYVNFNVSHSAKTSSTPYINMKEAEVNAVQNFWSLNCKNIVFLTQIFILIKTQKI